LHFERGGRAEREIHPLKSAWGTRLAFLSQMGRKKKKETFAPEEGTPPTEEGKG